MSLLVACTLAARLLVPAGFMPVAQGGRMTLALCPGMATAATAMAGMHHGPSPSEGHGRADAPCAYAGLGLSALGTADPVLLLVGLLFAFVLAIRAVVQRPPRASPRLRPPLRGPPAIA